MNANDPVLAARIVRNIAQIEDDEFMASGPLTEKLMSEIIKTIAKIAVDPWQIVVKDWDVRVVSPEWKRNKGVGTGDAWLEITEVGADAESERDYSWISTAVGAGPTRMALELVFRRGLRDAAEAAIRNDKHVAALWKAGMTRDETEPRLFFLIDIPVESLAQGYEQNDLDAALLPVGEAMKKAIAAKAELDKLVDRVRDEPKKK
ncbi:MAG: hypothetical protein KGP14_13715 [Betaproteobacteria bacterium]|nr:hypothetical protein [Betaproteobacteria bacterium]